MRLTSIALLAVFFTLAGCTEPDLRRPARTATDTEMQEAQLEPVTFGSTRPAHRLGNIYLTGQPAPEDFAIMQAAGVRTVINQRYPQEMSFSERAIVEDLGMMYINVPWNGPQDLTDQIFDRYRELLSSVEQPLLMHCASANRVGTVWLPWRVLDGGLSFEDALAEARAVGMRNPAYEQAARDYISRKQAAE